MRVSDVQAFVLDKLREGYRAVVYYDDPRSRLQIPGRPDTLIRVKSSTVNALLKRKFIHVETATTLAVVYKLRETQR